MLIEPDKLLDADLAALERYRSFDQGEKRIVASDADVLAGFERGAALAYDNGAGTDLLAAVGFKAAILCVAVPSVT